ncbi:MAG TPA: four helix bundle protein [Kofleriaceae bacterium]|jgi:four helix bundle protein
MLSFQKLRVYQRSIAFLALTVELLETLPKGHADLADQILRAAQSIPRNIAEGAGRRTSVDQARFYVMARGSAMECAATLDTMRIMKLLAGERYDAGIDHLEAVVAMLTKMC